MQIPSFSEEKLIELAKLTGGAALLVAIAVVLSGSSFFQPSGLAAAVVMADQDFGSSHLHLEAASDTVAPGGATTLTWSATNITDVPSNISCFGNGTTCGAIFQTLPQANGGTSYATRFSNFVSIDGASYILVGNPTSGGPVSRLYKWMPSLNCFGKDTSSACGTIFQSIPTYQNRFFKVGSQTYLVSSQSYQNSSLLVYKWMPPGTPTAAANPNGCFGNGTTCATALNTLNAVSISFTVFTIGSDTYLGWVTYTTGSGGNYVKLLKWSPSQQCFGNTVGTCGAVFQNIVARVGQTINNFTKGSDTYLVVGAATSPVDANKNGCDNVSLMNLCVYKWMPAGVPTATANPNGCFGTGSICSTSLWRTQYPALHAEPFYTTSGDVIFQPYINNTGSNFQGIAKWMPAGTPSTNITGCVGNGSTCGASLQGLWSNLYAEDLNGALTVDSNTFYAYGATAQMYRWMPPGIPSTNTKGCLGNGTACGTVWWTYYVSGSAVKGATFFSIPPNIYFVANELFSSGSRVYVYKATASATMPACSVLWSSASGSGTLANTNSGTNVSTGVLMENTIYTLDCVGVGSVPITVRVANLPTVGISAPSSVVYGSSVNVSATFTAGSGDTLTYTAINGPAPTPVPGGYNWMLAPGLSWTPPTDKIFVFDPQALGLSAGSSYTFIPDVYTQAYPNWDHSNNQSVVVSVMCTTGYAGSTCNQCAAGYAFDSTSQCKPFSCFDSGACSCSAGYTWNGSQCALAASAPTITSFSATRVRKGNAPTLTWTVTGMTSGMGCTITPAPPAGQPTWPGTSSWTGSALGISITAPTRFTLQCGSAAGGYSTQSTTAQLIPVFQEI